MRERRFIKGAEVRATGDGHIEGHAAVFNTEYVMWDSPSLRVTETIRPGTFSRVLGDNEQDPRCLFNHDPNMILGRKSAGTLMLEQNAKGLKFDCDVADTQAGRDTRTNIANRNVTGCSFAFTVSKQKRTEEEKEGKLFILREIQEVDNLYDVGPVTYPAYEGTDVTSRSLAELRGIFPDGVPASVLSHAPELRAQTEPDDTDPDDDGDDDTTPEGDTDHDYMDASLMADHYQAKAEHHEAMASQHSEHASAMRSIARSLPEGHDMKDCMSRMASHSQEQCDVHEEMAEHYREMQDSAFKDSERSARASTAKTKRVAGEDLPASAFAYVGDKNDTSTWKLPIKFSSEEKTKRHIRNALARFNQTKGIPDSEKPKVLAKIKAAAKKYGIGEDSEQNSALPSFIEARTKTLLAEIQ